MKRGNAAQFLEVGITTVLVSLLVLTMGVPLGYLALIWVILIMPYFIRTQGDPEASEMNPGRPPVSPQNNKVNVPLVFTGGRAGEAEAGVGVGERLKRPEPPVFDAADLPGSAPSQGGKPATTSSRFFRGWWLNL